LGLNTCASAKTVESINISKRNFLINALNHSSNDKNLS